jgi:hypothetical protein
MYLHARYFDPQLGTFLSPDPIGVEGGMNQYGYGLGDPVNGTDRTGLVKDECEDIEGCRRTTLSPLMSLGMGEFLSVITGPSGGILSPTLTAAVAEHEQQLIEKGHGGAYEYTDIDGTTSVTLDPEHIQRETGIAQFEHVDTGIRIRAEVEVPPAVRVAALGVPDELCHYACSSSVPGFAKPIVWAVMDSPWARADKFVLVAAANAAAQVGATGVEVVLVPIRVWDPRLIGDPNIRYYGTWYTVQEGFNDVWREFVFP